MAFKKASAPHGSSRDNPARWDEIKRARRLAANVRTKTNRFAIYDYLGAVYFACRKWKKVRDCSEENCNNSSLL